MLRASCGFVACSIPAGMHAAVQPCWVIGPDVRRIQLAVDECTTSMIGIAEEHADLAVLDAPGGLSALALAAGRVLPVLEGSHLVHNQHRVTLAQFVQRLLRQHIAREISIPLCPLKQMTVLRSRLIGRWGKSPAV